MALYGLEGEILAENDDFNGALQSGITAGNLEEGTYYIAVSQYNTIFSPGFVVNGPPVAANFLLNYGENQSIQGALPANGVQWFSFEIAPIVVPEVALSEVWLSGGTLNLSWQTDAGMTYRVQRSPDLQNWQNVGSLRAGTGSLLQHSQPVTGGRAFFRVVIP